MTSAKAAATTAALLTTIGLGGASWFVAASQMNAMMDMGVATPLGSFAPFVLTWMVMMAAMMLPGAAPAALAFARTGGRATAIVRFVGSYLAVWALAGAAVYVLYRPHETFAAGAIVIAAGAYEFTPLKGHFRRRCRESVRSGLAFGLSCFGSTIGLMMLPLALGIMSIKWMAVTTIIAVAQKLFPEMTAIDVPLRLTIVGFGILIIVAPSSVPGLAPT
jgi:predicted metal-binding membrane protein